MARTSTNRWIKCVAVAFLYFITGKLGTLTAIPPGLATALWPASGIALGAVLLEGYGIWPGIWFGSFLVNFAVALRAPNFSSAALLLLVILGVAVGSTLQAMLGGFLIRRFIRALSPFDRIQDVFKFVGIEMASCLVASSAGAFALLNTGSISFPEFLATWYTWWLGDLVGILEVTPLIFILAGYTDHLRWNSIRITEGVILFAAVVALGGSIFGSSFPLTISQYPLVYFLIPMLLWASFRFGQKGAILSILILSAEAIAGTLRGLGPFTRGDVHESLLLLQAFMGVITGTVLVLSAALNERRNAVENLKSFAATLEKSNQDLEQFAYVSSHDLKEPVRMIKLFSQLIERNCGEKLDPVANEYLKYVIDGANRMQGLIDALLKYASTGKAVGGNETADFNAVLRAVKQNLKANIEENDAVVVSRSLPTLVGDPVLFTQLFQNLISNALKFRRLEKPKIYIEAQREERDWLFSVRDNGIGIDSQYVSKIFEIFKRLHGSKEIPGTGIGLAICKKIVENHNGKIWVESEVGVGSTFYFTIPAFS